MKHIHLYWNFDLLKVYLEEINMYVAVPKAMSVFVHFLSYMLFLSLQFYNFSNFFFLLNKWNMISFFLDIF